MKVPSETVARAPVPSRSRESKSSQPKAFDSVMERKSQERNSKNDDAKPSGQLPPDEIPLLAPTGPFLPAPVSTVAPPAIEAPAGLTEVRDLDGLVHEILVVAGPGAKPTVEIQFHSSTLEGLNVRIAKDGDDISIRFLTSSNTVAQLLSRKSDQLTQGLEAKGLHVAPIQVELAPQSPRVSDARPSFRDGRQGRGDGRRQGQKQ